MDAALLENKVKYDAWVKPLLVFPIVLLIGLGILFYIDACSRDIFPREPESESLMAFYVMIVTAVIILAVYWFTLPHSIFVYRDKIKIVFGGFAWNIPFKNVVSVKAARGLVVWWGYNCITSYGSQIEILRKNRMKIRISPENRDQFLEYANRALEDWRKIHASS
jgi:hypothetical protein